MFSKLLLLVAIYVILEKGALGDQDGSRQKRCIVVQKQSGGREDSPDDDEDYREAKEQKPDKTKGVDFGNRRRSDLEELQPELLKYKLLPTKPKNDLRRLWNRLYRLRYQ